MNDVSELPIALISKKYIGRLNNKHCFACEIDPASGVPENGKFYDLRSAYGLIHEDLFSVAGRALHITDWDNNNKFCGRCGKPLIEREYERVKICSSCDMSYYPKLSPAIIVAVTKKDKILLAHGKNFPQGRYSVIAGFVDIGETLEACVTREVKEETNIEIKNIDYFSSLPWPCTDSLMIGFTAEYSKGSIKVDGEEITEAGWFTADTLPEVPGKVSLAWKLVNWFVERKY